MTYHITRMFCEHQTFANLVRSQKGSNFLLIWLIAKVFHTQNILVIRYESQCLCSTRLCKHKNVIGILKPGHIYYVMGSLMLSQFFIVLTCMEYIIITTSISDYSCDGKHNIATSCGLNTTSCQCSRIQYYHRF